MLLGMHHCGLSAAAPHPYSRVICSRPTARPTLRHYVGVWMGPIHRPGPKELTWSPTSGSRPPGPGSGPPWPAGTVITGPFADVPVEQPAVEAGQPLRVTGHDVPVHPGPGPVIGHGSTHSSARWSSLSRSPSCSSVW